MRASFALFGLSVFSLTAMATTSVPRSLDFGIHEEYVSTRAEGMGNAFTAVADDHSAIFYNPSMLAWREDGQLRMFLRAGTDASALKLKGEINSAKAETDQTAAYANLIESNYGNHYWARVPTIGAMWVRPGWGIAFIPADLSLDVDPHRQVGPSLNVNTYLDSTLAFSLARKSSLFGKDHDLSFGATFKAVHRVYVGEEVNAGELAQGQSVFSTSQAQEGLTGDIDLASTWRPPVPEHGFFSFLHYMKPTFAIVGRNLLDYGFKTDLHLIKNDGGAPPNLIRRFDIGSKWDLPKWWVFDPHLSADIRDLDHPNWTLRNGTHVGMELYWKMYNWWKGHYAFGYNEGYWTAGLGARLAWFQIDLATFGEQVGADTVPKEDRRYMLELALDF